MIPAPSIAVASLVSQQQAGRPATMAHYVIINHNDETTLGIVERAGE